MLSWPSIRLSDQPGWSIIITSKSTSLHIVAGDHLCLSALRTPFFGAYARARAAPVASSRRLALAACSKLEQGAPASEQVASRASLQ
jgi:hypothetical protein